MKKLLLLLALVMTINVYASDTNNTEILHDQQVIGLSDGHTHTSNDGHSSTCGHKDIVRLEELKNKKIIQITKTELIVDSVKLGDYMETLEKKHAGTNLNLEILAISRVLQTYSYDNKLDLVKK